MDFDVVKSLGEQYAYPSNRGIKDFVDKTLCHFAKPVMERNENVGVYIKEGKNKGKKLAVISYLDEPGFLVKGYLGNGFIQLHEYGTINTKALSVANVVVFGKEEKYGVIGLKSTHYVTPEELLQPVDVEQLFIDVGITDDDRIREEIKVGDFIGFQSDFAILRNQTIVGHGLSTKLGTAVLMEIAEKAQGSCDVYFIVACRNARGQGEIRRVLEGIQPDCTLVIDSRDTNKLEDDPEAAVIGGGPALSYGGNVDYTYTKDMMRLSKKLNIDVQKQIHCYNINDVDVSLYGMAGGIPCVFLFLPVENYGMPYEIVKEKDLDSTVRLIVHFVNTFEA